MVSQLAANRVRSGGAIINFSTTVTRTAFSTYGAYAASRAAVEAMTLILARGPEGIAEVVAFLAAPGRRVNGQVVNANGGLA